MERVFTQTFGVVGAIIEKDGKILLIKEADGPDVGKWNHPAGMIDVGEDPIEAGRREVKEETGFDFTPTHVLGVYSMVRKDLNPTHHPIKIIFIGNISDERMRKLADDVSEIRWFTPEEIEKMDADILRYLDIKQMVKDYFSSKRFSLDLLTHIVSE
jgi:ADP-ribose pyrophosphatase YjhB (NUDIX family)